MLVSLIPSGVLHGQWLVDVVDGGQPGLYGTNKETHDTVLEQSLPGVVL